MKRPPNRALDDAIKRTFGTIKEFCEELADKLDQPIEKSMVTHWLDGRSYPRSPTVQKTVAEILRVKAEDIFPPRERQKWPKGKL